MKFFKTYFCIRSLNQEKIFSALSKKFKIQNIIRVDKQNSSFEISYFQTKKLKKELQNFNVEIKEERHIGFLPYCFSMFKNVWFLVAFFVSLGLYILQANFIFEYQIVGLENLNSKEVVGFIKQNTPKLKSKISNQNVEEMLAANFDEISFVSVIVKGQTLIVNVKEKLLPEEIYGEFVPIIADFDGKVVSIDVVSGMPAVKVGDYVFKGDTLVNPYYIDGDGVVHNIKTKANITLETYTVGTANFYDEEIVLNRTGNFYVQNEISLFGISIYKKENKKDFKLFESETTDRAFSKNLILPFKFTKTVVYELEEKLVISDFQSKESEIVEKAHKNALEKSKNYDKIKNEFYNVKHSAGVSVVSYVIVGEKVVSNDN